MKFSIIISILLVFYSQKIAFSQGEGNNWYFGNFAGITFNTSPPSVLNNGKLNTGEGCASVSDKNGGLVFYTDGSTVYDANHNVMPNGTGLFGNPSSTQSSVVCPKPGTYNYGLRRFDRYYIITIEVFNGTASGGNNGGVRYTEVDMTLNGGLGSVITSQKNILLFGTTTVEGANVAKHENGCDYWIIGKEVGTNAFNVYLITSAGVASIPVVSNVGEIATATWGSIKVSPNNKLISFNSNAIGTQVFDFNNSTGMLTLKFFDTQRSYSSDFSPNNNVLYVTHIPFPEIWQYDLTSANNSDFLSSKLLVGTTSNTSRNYKMCGVQLAPDGKIYTALLGEQRLGAIENPNTLGLGCSYNDNAISLVGINSNSTLTGQIMQSTLGLPAFPAFFIFPNDLEFESANYSSSNPYFCNSDSITFRISNISSVQSVSWYFSSVNTPYSLSPNAIGSEFKVPPPSLGTYKIRSIVDYSCFIDTIIDTITVNPIPIINRGEDDTLNCAVSSINLIGSVIPNNSSYNYQWSTTIGNIVSGATNASATVNIAADYYLTVTDATTGCFSSQDTVTIVIDTISPSFTAGLDTLLTCENKAITLNATNNQLGNFNYNWTTTNGNIQNGSNTISPLINQDGNYNLTVTNNINLCSGIDSLIVGIDTINPIVQVSIDTLINCINPEINLSGIGSSTGNYSYLWYSNDGNILSGNTTLSPEINSEGTYFLIVTNNFNGCTSNDSINVILDNSVNVEINFNNSFDSIFSVFSFDENTISYDGNNGPINWWISNNDFGNDSIITHSFEESGIQQIIIELTNSENGCIAYDTSLITVTHRLIIPSAISPNIDGFNDVFLIRALENYDENSLTIFNRWGEKVYSSSPYLNDWNGQVNSSNVLLGSEVTDGTYFYLLSLTENGEELIYKGAIEVKRGQ